MSESQNSPTQSARFRLKEPFCALSQYTGAVFSVAALILLMWTARRRPLPTLGASLYGGSLIALYLASALSHTWYAPLHVEKWLNSKPCASVAVAKIPRTETGLVPPD